MKRLVSFTILLLMLLTVIVAAQAEPYPHEHYSTCTTVGWCALCGEPYESDDIRHTVRCDNMGTCYWCGQPCDDEPSVHYGTWHYVYNEEKHWEICDTCNLVTREDEHFVACRNPHACMDCDVYYTGDDIRHGYTHLERGATQHWEACDDCGEALGEPFDHVPSAENPDVCWVCGGSLVISLDGADISMDNPLGKLAIFKDGAVVDYTGFAKFDGVDFYFTHGVIDESKTGVVNLLGTWYAFDYGRVMMEEMLVPFEGGVFYFRDGKLNTNASGLIPFHTAEGSGIFLFAYGQFQPGVNGPWMDPYDGTWYYLAESQRTYVTDIVPFDGEKFFFIEGKLATYYTGNATGSDGIVYYVVNGQVQQEALVWIPRTGSKYHSSADCSNMKSPSQITVSEAIRRGYKPCDKCY